MRCVSYKMFLRIDHQISGEHQGLDIEPTARVSYEFRRIRAFDLIQSELADFNHEKLDTKPVILVYGI